MEEPTTREVIEEYFKNYSTWEGIEEDFKTGIEYCKNYKFDKRGVLTFPKKFEYMGIEYILFIGIAYYIMGSGIYLDYEYIKKYSISINVFKN